jgi:hypothetical protein
VLIGPHSGRAADVLLRALALVWHVGITVIVRHEGQLVVVIIIVVLPCSRGMGVHGGWLRATCVAIWQITGPSSLEPVPTPRCWCDASGM